MLLLSVESVCRTWEPGDGVTYFTTFSIGRCMSTDRPGFDQILKVGSWDLFEHIPTVTMTFVQITFFLAAFVHVRNISAVTIPILMKL